jgi:hypothetical protein
MEQFLPGRNHDAELDEMARYEETELKGIVAVPATSTPDNIPGCTWPWRLTVVS